MINRQVINPSDDRGVARMYPLGDLGCDSDVLNFSRDIVGETPRHLELGSTESAGFHEY